MNSEAGTERNAVALVSPLKEASYEQEKSTGENHNRTTEKKRRLILRIGPKLMIIIFLVGITPFAIMGGFSVRNWSQALTRQSYDRLAAAAEGKKDQLERLYSNQKADLEAMTETVLVLRQEAVKKISAAREASTIRVRDFFEKIKQNLSLLAASPDALQAFVKIRTYKDGYDDEIGDYLETIDVTTEDYASIYDAVSPFFKSYAKINGYDNIFIVDVELRNVIFSLVKKEDLGANLNKGPLKDSGLGRVVDQAIKNEGQAFQDFAPYQASEGRQAAFIADIIKDGFDRTQAVLVFQLSPQPLQELVGRQEGMGRTGETFLIAQSGKEIVLRSYASGLTETPLKAGRNISAYAHDFMNKALSGETGRESFADGQGRPILTAYSGLNVFGRQWAVVSMAPLEEVIAPRLDGDQEDFFTKRGQASGYSDILLISPQSRVFYSTAGLSDRGANLSDGPYKDSGLARAFYKAMQSKAPIFEDISLYQPAQNRPMAFMASPALGNDGRVEVVVAISLPLAEFNAVMNEESALGKHGQAMLIGSDFLPRSDAQVTVADSFLDPKPGLFDSPGIREALAGKKSTRLVEKKDGRQVLEAYVPVRLGDVTWVSEAGLERDKAFAEVDKLKQTMGLIALGVTLAAVLIAWLLARTFSRPLKRAVDALGVTAGGDLTCRLNNNSRDELGELAGRFNYLLEAFREIIRRVLENSLVLNQASRNLTDVSGALTEGAKEMSSSSGLLARRSQQIQTNMAAAESANLRFSQSVRQTASALEDLTSSMTNIADNAGQAARSAKEASEIAHSSSSTAKELAQNSGEIGHVVNIISSIAKKTRLLAINASIEAARAGTAGRGFAVVADEVKGLADQTAESTNGVQTRIQALQDSTENVLTAIGKITEAIETHNQLAQKIASAASNQSRAAGVISQNVSEAAEAAEQVSDNTTQAASFIREINTGIVQASQTAEKTAQGSEQVLGASVRLAGQAEALLELIGRFKT